MRLDKFLAGAGMGTRSEVKKLLKSGEVTLSGFSGRLQPQQQVDPERDSVFVAGKQVVYREYIYLMLNKPAGYISATWDKKLPTVLDLVDEEYLRFEPAPVGRLDIDTEGLLILTNDGALSHRLLSPKRHVPKTYFARLDGGVGETEVQLFRQGVVLEDGYQTKPAELYILGQSGDAFEVEIVITEGKFHQIKRMFESVGRRVLYLKRIKMNRLALDDSLALGAIRELTAEELELLQFEGE